MNFNLPNLGGDSMDSGKLTDVSTFIEKLMYDPDMDFNKVAGCCQDVIDTACKCVIEGCFTWEEIRTLVAKF